MFEREGHHPRTVEGPRRAFNNNAGPLRHPDFVLDPSKTPIFPRLFFFKSSEERACVLLFRQEGVLC